MREATAGRHEEQVIAVHGALDAAAAWKLGDMLESSPPGARVVLDFSHAENVHDFGLAVLAMVLADHVAVAVQLRGLCRHHERMLRYFGVDLASMFDRLQPSADDADAGLAMAAP